MSKKMAKPTIENKNTRERIMIKMWIYIVTSGIISIGKPFLNLNEAKKYAEEQTQKTNWLHSVNTMWAE